MKTKNSYGGYCAKCKFTHSISETDNSRKYALELICQLEKYKTLDFSESSEKDTRLNIDYLWSKAGGQMFGVMEAKNLNGNTLYFKAFSGQYNGIWFVENWVPPILDFEKFNELIFNDDKQIKSIGNKLNSEKLNSEEKHKLILQRKKISQNLQQNIFNLYELSNFRKEKKLLKEVYNSTNGIPTGTGDCCAPKLLNFAIHNSLIPIGISEFYFGKENLSKTKKHKHFYSACKEKCEPILGFILCGLNANNSI